MGQAHVRRWIDDLLPIVSDDRDPLGVRQFATHHLPLEDARTGTRSSAIRRRVASRSCSSPKREPARLTVGATVRSNRTSPGGGLLAGSACEGDVLLVR
jgi:hypothetical protein